MLKIRLARTGVRHKPFYRIVAIDERKKLNTAPLEIIGTWQPSVDAFLIDKKKLEAWVKKGAQISSAVKELLEKK
ncbi:30S ribosomal protein S16 [Patescibacteria group bacterium]|nr:30S ribosomal protein S16 [Patescibacteria group bacterium]